MLSGEYPMIVPGPRTFLAAATPMSLNPRWTSLSSAAATCTLSFTKNIAPTSRHMTCILRARSMKARSLMVLERNWTARHPPARAAAATSSCWRPRSFSWAVMTTSRIRSAQSGRRPLCTTLPPGSDVLHHVGREARALLAGEEHPPEDRTHPRRAVHRVRRHARDQQVRVDLAGVLDDDFLSNLRPHGHLTHDSTGVRVELAPRYLSRHGSHDVGVVPCRVHDNFRFHRQRVHVQVGKLHRPPVEHHPRDLALLADEHVLDGNAYPDLDAGVHCRRGHLRDRLDRVADVVSIFELGEPHPELIKYRTRCLLDDDAGEEHAAAPHAAAHVQVPLEHADVQSLAGEVIGAGHPRRAATRDRHVRLQRAQEVSGEALQNAPGHLDLRNRHLELLPVVVRLCPRRASPQ